MNRIYLWKAHAFNNLERPLPLPLRLEYSTAAKTRCTNHFDHSPPSHSSPPTEPISAAAETTHSRPSTIIDHEQAGSVAAIDFVQKLAYEANLTEIQKTNVDCDLSDPDLSLVDAALEHFYCYCSFGESNRLHSSHRFHSIPHTDSREKNGLVCGELNSLPPHKSYTSAGVVNKEDSKEAIVVVVVVLQVVVMKLQQHGLFVLDA